MNGCLEKTVHIRTFQQPSVEFQKTKSPLEVDDSIIKNSRMFSDVQRNILDTHSEKDHSTCKL
jgi:hypothetical protein